MKYFNLTKGFAQKSFMLSVLIFSMGLSVLAQSNETQATATSLYNEGLAELKEKNYESGLDLMEKALVKAEKEGQEKVIELAKKNGSVAAYNVGNEKRKNGELVEAVALFEKGIELNPENASNYLGKAMTLEEIEINTETVIAYMVAGDMYTKADQIDRAEKMVIKSRNIIINAFIDKNYDFTIEAGKAYLALDNNADIHYYIGKSFSEKGMNDEALAHINQAITLSKGNEEADFDKFYYAKAQILESANKIDEAIAAYKMVKGEKYKDQVEYKIKNLDTN